MNLDERTLFNGWANYVTWLVHLSLTNEQEQYFHWRERTREIVDEQLMAENDVPSCWHVVHELRESVEVDCGIPNASLAADLMNAALSEVDWCEIAQEFIDDVSPPQFKNPGLFALGKIITTPKALRLLTHDDRINALARHSHGDWGEIDAAHWAQNEVALKVGFRLVSVYHSQAGMEFWTITESDRSVTTILLPDDN